MIKLLNFINKLLSIRFINIRYLKSILLDFIDFINLNIKIVFIEKIIYELSIKFINRIIFIADFKIWTAIVVTIISYVV